MRREYEPLIYDVFEGTLSSPATGGLSDLCSRLLADQDKTWKELAQAYEALETTQVRDIACSGYTVRLQHNRRRKTSTFAAVGVNDVKDRPCFLCAGHLPDGQQAILYRNDYLILANPMPVFPGHLTIAHREHRPQTILGHAEAFVRLIADLGPEWIVLYNGPRCGASAPDHLHFQAIPAGQTPIESELDETRLTTGEGRDGTGLHTLRGIGRLVIVIDGDKPASLLSVFENQMNRLSGSMPDGLEPMVNVAGFITDRGWRILLFPRRKHRPDAFFREGTDRIAVSPAVVEMMGVIVTPVEKDFQRLDAPAIEDIYREVSAGTGSPAHTPSPIPTLLPAAASLTTNRRKTYHDSMSKEGNFDLKRGYCINCDNKHGCKTKNPPCIIEMAKANISGASGKSYLVKTGHTDLCRNCPFFRSCWKEEEYSGMVG